MDAIPEFTGAMLTAGMTRLNGGKLEIYTLNYATKLCEFTASSPAFGAPTAANPCVCTMTGVPKAATGLATGLAEAFRWVNSGGVTQMQRSGPGSVDTANAFVILADTSIETGQPVRLIMAGFQMPTTVNMV